MFDKNFNHHFARSQHLSHSHFIHLGFSEGSTLLSVFKSWPVCHTDSTKSSIMSISQTFAILPHAPNISQYRKVTFLLETVWKGMEKSLIFYGKKMTSHFNNKSTIFIELTIIICFYEPRIAKGINFLLVSPWTFRSQEWFICFVSKINQVKNGKILWDHRRLFPSPVQDYVLQYIS